jgi:hypothetical protein
MTYITCKDDEDTVDECSKVVPYIPFPLIHHTKKHFEYQFA